MIKLIARIIFILLAFPIAICIVFGLWIEGIVFFLIALYINHSLCKKIKGKNNA